MDPCYDEVFSAWMAFGGNKRDLGSFREETDEITDLHQILEKVLLTERGDGVAGIKRRRRDPYSDGVRDLVMVLGRSRLNEDLESSTQRQLQDYNATPFDARTTPTPIRVVVDPEYQSLYRFSSLVSENEFSDGLWRSTAAVTTAAGGGYDDGNTRIVLEKVRGTSTRRMWWSNHLENSAEKKQYKSIYSYLRHVVALVGVGRKSLVETSSLQVVSERVDLRRWQTKPRKKGTSESTVVDENWGRCNKRQDPKKTGSSKDVVASLDRRVAGVETTMAELKTQVEGLEGLDSDFTSMRKDFWVAINTLGGDLECKIHDLIDMFMGKITKLWERSLKKRSSRHIKALKTCKLMLH
ncbi:hypothetical protein Tco_0627907 [Tanacetum coccineum]|uniref:Uncharacterized protein n=1 Tax=Tanacetum coccineum TaxID=301880 RepID=A0ABQ4WNV3_9ASTR